MKPSRERIVAAIIIGLFVCLGVAARGAAHEARAPVLVPPGVGVQNPAVYDGNVQETVCVPGWSARQRPPTSFTGPLKLKLLRGSGYADQNPRHYELDHAWSIENGGAPADPSNLWLQYSLGPCNSHDKDRLENAVHRQLCAGNITVAEAGAALLGDWVASYNRYVGPLTCQP